MQLIDNKEFDEEFKKLDIIIKNGINDKILSSSRIRDVVFQQKDVIEQN